MGREGVAWGNGRGERRSGSRYGYRRGDRDGAQ